MRGQVLWSKSGAQVPVDLTTAPVRDGDQLVGAVMTFTDRRPYEELAKQHTEQLAQLTESHTTEVTELTERHTAEVTGLTEQHAAELADRSERYAAELEEQTERLTDLTARHTQLTAVLGESLRGPLEELRGELSTLAADPAGQLWPEANQILHHLAAGYARMATLVDNVLSFQRLDAGAEQLVKEKVLLDGVVTAGIDARRRADRSRPGPVRGARAADRGRGRRGPAGDRARASGRGCRRRRLDRPGTTGAGRRLRDSTVVVAAAQRGEVVRIEVRGPFAGRRPGPRADRARDRTGARRRAPDARDAGHERQRVRARGAAGRGSGHRGAAGGSRRAGTR